MPSPVIGLTSAAASPTSSTGPSGCCQRQPDSGRWWPRQRVPPAPAPGISRSSCSSSSARLGGAAACRRAGQQLAVADVGPARRRGRRPRRTPAGGGRRSGSPGLPRRSRPSSARSRGWRWPAARGRSPSRCGRTTECAPSAPTTTRARDLAVEHAPRRRDLEPAHPVPPQHGARRDGALDQPGVEDLARDDVHRPRHRPGDHGRRRGPARGAAAAPSRRRRRARRRSASASRTCGAMPSPQHLSRGKSARSSSSTRSAGSAASAPSAARRRPGRRPRRPGPRTPRPSQASPRAATTSSRAMPTAARTAAGRARAARRRRAAATTSQAAPAAPGATSAPSRTTTTGAEHEHRRGHRASQRGAEPVRQPADAGRGVVGEVGQHVEEVGADPEQGAGQRQPHRRQAGSSSASATNTGSPPNATAYGSHDQTVAFSPRL